MDKNSNPSSAPNDPATQAHDRHHSRRRWLIENVVSLGLAILLVLMIRSSVIEPFRIPSGSMIPTLLIGDHIFVNKFAYGIMLPFTDWLMDEPVYLVRRGEPQSGDIIVFRYPKDESVYYIKRVIGTPGDTIELRDKQLYINGEPVPREALPEPRQKEIITDIDTGQYHRASLELYHEELASADPVVMIDQDNFLGDNFGPVTVPAEQYFVMGDNRDFSNDSRFWGFVPMENVKGKAFLIWFSIWFNPDWGELGESEFSFRPGRIGTVLN